MEDGGNVRKKWLLSGQITLVLGESLEHPFPPDVISCSLIHTELHVHH